MEKLGFAVIGCGTIGKLPARVIHANPNAVLVALCDVNEESGTRLAEELNCKYYKDYMDALNDSEIQAVSICLPSGMHAAITIAAANAGKHIICEKPIDIEVSRAEDMVNAAKRNGVQLGVILQHRFDPPVQLLYKAIEDGRLGKPLWGAARTIWYRDNAYFANPWRGTWAFDGGGALINQSIHYIDLLLSVLGDVRSISGKCRKVLHHQIETEDVGVANLEFTNGSIGTIEGTTVAYPGLYAELCIFCERGTMIIRNDELLFYQLATGKDEEFESLLNPKKANQYSGNPEVDSTSHSKQYADFIESIQFGRKPKVTGEDALKSLQVIKGIYRASEEKREIYLSQE